MIIAYIILAHDRPDLVGHLARRLLDDGGPVVIHYDKRAPSSDFQKLWTELGEQTGSVIWPTRVSVRWGEWSIVQATLNALEALVITGKSIDYVQLLSGSDYPIKPISEFRSFLERNKGEEFIECADMRTKSWVQDGLTHERYKYRHFFNWRKHGVLFDKNWKFQRAMGLTRNFPPQLIPHLGSQWWTLPWDSVMTIVAAGRDKSLISFFKTVWIPDEMFVQSVIGSVDPAASRRAVLTLYQFTDAGIPVVYFDDHLSYLVKQPFFFARKLAPSAAALRRGLDDSRVLLRDLTISDSEVGIRTLDYRNFVKDANIKPPTVRLLGCIPDAWWGSLAYLKNPTIAVFGISPSDLHKVAKKLNQSSVVECHGALFDAAEIGFKASFNVCAGYTRSDFQRRDASRLDFLYDVLSASVGTQASVAGFLLPRGTDSEIREQLAWSKSVHVIVVRGSAFNGYVESQQASIDRTELKRKSSDYPIMKPINRADDVESLADWVDGVRQYHIELENILSSSDKSYLEVDLLEDDWAIKIDKWLSSSVLGEESVEKLTNLYAAQVWKEDFYHDHRWLSINWDCYLEYLDRVPSHGWIIEQLNRHVRRFIGSESRIPKIVLIGGTAVEAITIGGIVVQLLSRGGRSSSLALNFERSSFVDDGLSQSYLWLETIKNLVNHGLIPVVPVSYSELDKVLIEALLLQDDIVPIILRGQFLAACTDIFIQTKANLHETRMVGTIDTFSGFEVGALEMAYREFYETSSLRFANPSHVVDLLSSRWVRQLLDTLQVEGLFDTYRTTALQNIDWSAVDAEDKNSFYRNNMLENLRIINLIHDEAIKIGQLARLGAQVIGRMPCNFTVILGASAEEVNEVGRLMADCGISSFIQDVPWSANADRHSKMLEMCMAEGGRKQETVLSTWLHATWHNKGEFCVALNWSGSATVLEDIFIADPSARVIIVKGSIHRAFAHWNSQIDNPDDAQNVKLGKRSSENVYNIELFAFEYDRYFSHFYSLSNYCSKQILYLDIQKPGWELAVFKYLAFEEPNILNEFSKPGVSRPSLMSEPNRSELVSYGALRLDAITQAMVTT